MEMNYGDEIQEADWSMLKPHYMRDALFVVAPELTLEEVAKAISTDDTKNVTSWIEGEKLKRPSVEQDKTWDKEPNRKLAKFIIVQPYVLMQLIEQ